MKLPKFLKRGNDEEDEDDEDFEGFDDEEFDPDSAAGGGGYENAADIMSDDSVSEDNADSTSEDDGRSGDMDVPDGIYGDDDEDDDDIDFGDDDEDDDDDEEGTSARTPLLFIILGAVVLIGGIAGGAAFWVMSDEDEPASASAPPTNSKRVALALPPKRSQKSLNSGGLNSRVANPESGAEQSKDAKAPASEVAKPQPSAPAPAKVAPSLAPVSSLGAGGLNARAGKAGGPRQGLIIPAATAASYRKIADQSKTVPLASAPDQALEQVVQGLEGPLPIIGKDGRKPWEVYSRPVGATGSDPRVAILVKGLGFSRAVSMAAIKKLPGDVSLSFSPYARDLNDWLVRARLGGHEVFLELPMESKNFPAEDAGPLGLNTNLQVADNIKRLHQVMSKMGGYVGLVSTMGSKYSEAEGQLKPILQEIRKRGLMFVDGTGAKTAAPRIAAEIQLPKAFVNIVLDEPPDRQSLDRKLKSMEGIVKKQSVAVAVIHAYPSTIERLIIWVRTMKDRQMTLVPLSAVADKQFFE